MITFSQFFKFLIPYEAESHIKKIMSFLQLFQSHYQMKKEKKVLLIF